MTQSITLDDIRRAVDAGERVYYKDDLNIVLEFNGRYFVNSASKTIDLDKYKGEEYSFYATN